MSDNDKSGRAIDKLINYGGKLGEPKKEDFNININIRDFSKKATEEEGTNNG